MGQDWQGVDEGWGRRAVDFATLSEPGNCREYVSLHQHLGVGRGDRLLDIACGSGLAVELAAARGADCAGIDASPRLVAVARDRSPAADLRVGDMHDLPWDDGTFDVVTSFRGIWGTTPDALAEVHRVLRPGGRVGITVWGHLKASPGAWALKPFTLAAEPKVRNQAAMVALGRPGVGEELLARFGFTGVHRVEVPFAWEFPDPESYARALAATGPAYEAIQAVGEEAFHAYAVEVAAERVRDGLPLRAEVPAVGYVARAPAASGSFLAEAAPTERGRAMYDGDLTDRGFVMNLSRMWAHQPAAHAALFDLVDDMATAAGLSFRDRGLLISATASTMGDSYCSLAWGNRLAGASDGAIAAGVLTGSDEGLDDRERTLVRWARRVARDPNATTAEDVEALRAVGYDDGQVHAITTFVALRLAFSTVNDALGAVPDDELTASVDPRVRDAVTWGR